MIVGLFWHCDEWTNIGAVTLSVELMWQPTASHSNLELNEKCVDRERARERVSVWEKEREAQHSLLRVKVQALENFNDILMIAKPEF